MNRGRRRLLAGITLAIAALMMVASASASAAVWKEGSTNVTTAFELSLSGGEVFEIGGGTGGMNCAVKATMTSSGGSTAKVTKYEVTGCTGFGSLSKCTVSSTKAEGLPWTATVNAGLYLTVASEHINRTFSAGCSPTSVNNTITSTKWAPDNPSSIKEFEFSNEGSSYKSFGSLVIEGANSGKYGLG